MDRSESEEGCHVFQKVKLVRKSFLFFFLGELKTTIKAGATFNITWHLGYPHQGGFRLELLDSKEKHLLDLTPTSDDESQYVTGDTT